MLTCYGSQTQVNWRAPSFLQSWNVRCVACETLTVFASNDENVPQYAVHQDDKTELEMIGEADLSKTQRRRAYGELESEKNK